MRGDISCDMSNKRDRVLSHFQILRGELKIRRTVEYFWRTSKSLEMWWATVYNVWYIFSEEATTNVTVMMFPIEAEWSIDKFEIKPLQIAQLKQFFSNKTTFIYIYALRTYFFNLPVSVNYARPSTVAPARQDKAKLRKDQKTWCFLCSRVIGNVIGR